MINIFVKVLRFLLKPLPAGAHEIIEMLTQEYQGKGYLTSIQEEVSVFIKLLDGATGHGETNEANDGILFLDIGGNLGDWTKALIQARPSSVVSVIEPNPLLVGKLKKHFEGNQSVDVQQIALANSDGILPFYADSAESAMGSLQLRDVKHLGYEFELIAEVRVTTLDKLLKGSTNPLALKIDVEGLELQVLRGAIESLNRVLLIQFEFGGTNIDSRVFFKDIFQLLVDSQFSIFRLCPKGRIKRIEKYSENDECFKFTTYYALKV
jgi:FkbM family methyltransferase